MSAKDSLELEDGADEVCASCGTAAVDDTKLKLCDGGCDLVKYCSDECQENHRDQHNNEYKKRKAEMHDKQLFTKNDISYLGECPICCLPLPLDSEKSTLMGCCCKIICKGCNYANQKREIDQGLEPRCAFCREPVQRSEKERIRQLMERVKKNDPVAMSQMGKKHYKTGDFGKAFEYWTKAAELGGVDAHGCLGLMHGDGNGVEKDTKKAVYHWEQAAIGGHPQARSFLATHEMDNFKLERAAKHLIIAANLGHDESLKVIKGFFKEGIVSKDDYAAALRGHQAAVDATKSAEREVGEAFFERYN